MNSIWNQKLSNNFSKIWFNWCKRILPLRPVENPVDFEFKNAFESYNYKEIFLNLLRQSVRLENGKLFRAYTIGPTEINAISTYNNIICSGEKNNQENNSNNLFIINMNNSSKFK